MKIKLLIIAFFIPIFTSFNYEIEELAIIVSAEDEIDSLTIERVREIFLKNDTAEKFVARDMKENSEENVFFITKVLKLSNAQLRDHWSSKMNSGYSQWPRKNTPRAMISFVSRGGRIGYVDANTLPSLPKADKVKVVLIVK